MENKGHRDNGGGTAKDPPGLLRALGTGISATVVGLLLNWVVISGTVSMFNRFSPGSTIRPVGIGIVYGMCMFAGCGLGVPLGVLAVMSARKSGLAAGIVLGALGIALSLLPMPVGMFLFQHLVESRNLTVRD